MNYYLAGPFFNEECSKFFEEVIERCKETSMANYETKHEVSVGAVSFNTSFDEKDDVEPNILNQDKIFVPGHFRVDFNKIKSEYDPVSFRRVLRQVLDLDLQNITDGLIVYPKGYDLGTMFELGYFLARSSGGGKFIAYNELRKRLIIKDPDEELIRCIDKLISRDFWMGISKNYQGELSSNPDDTSIVISEGSPLSTRSFTGFLGFDDYFNLVALNVDNYKESPFNSMLAGFLYALCIPFVTYSFKNADSNVMMLASSLTHIKVDPTKVSLLELDNVLKGMDFPKLFWDDSYFDKFKDIK